jgi:hypothetical protein
LGLSVDTKEFIKLVVPAEGHICIADHITFDDGKKAFVHYPFQDHDKAGWFAQKMDEREGTIYFALATFKECFTNQNGKLRLKRTHKNVALLKSIWLDIDFKDCPAENIVPKLRKFFGDTGLPKPSMIVNSGGGLHVYWCLKDSITPERWVPLAEGLKKLCQDHDLPADHGCTSDQARVLRPIGTHNRKYGEPKEVKVIAGDGSTYTYEELLVCFPKIDTNELPAHLRGKAVDTKEYASTGFTPREVDPKKVIRDCGILRHVLKTKGAEQSEPEWNATLLLLRFMPEGAKFVHPMSEGHIDYTPSATADKWQQKLDADVTGPPFCSTFQQFHGTSKCQNCPIFQSKKPKNPLALGYVSGTDQPTEKLQKNSSGIFVTVPTHDFPYGWRAIPGNLGVERKVFNPKEGEHEWIKVLKRSWRLQQAQRSTNSNEYTYVVEAKTVTGRSIALEIQGQDLWGSTRTWETLSGRGVPLTTDEQKHWKDLMATWLQKLQEESAVLDTTDQLGWIERVDENDDRKIVGFASGGTAHFTDGSAKNSVVTANHKHKGIADYYTPVGKPERWIEAAQFLINQGHDHIIAALASAFAGPLMKFTGQSGAVMSVVSSCSGMGKSLSLETAAAVWGSPKLGTITLQDTPTTVKNKLAYLQNITAYWDEVRGDDRSLNDFMQTAFQVTQGKDRERADRQARTIAAQTWHTLLVCMSNESIFDLAAAATKLSDAGVYRVFELYVNDNEKPHHDPAIQSLVAELQNNHGAVGEVYGQYLAANMKAVRRRVEEWRLKLESHFKSEAAERFWIATLVTLLVGAEFAGKAGIVQFDIPKLLQYLSKHYKQLRARVVTTHTAGEPQELLVAYMMAHQHERLVVDKLRIGRGGKYEPQMIGNYSNVKKITYQVGQDQNLLRVAKQDFDTWLVKSRGLRMTGELERRFMMECGMVVSKSTIGAATSYATSRAWCYDFTIDVDETIGEEDVHVDS